MFPFSFYIYKIIYMNSIFRSQVVEAVYKHEEFNKTKCQICVSWLNLVQLYFRNVKIYIGYIAFQCNHSTAYIG